MPNSSCGDPGCTTERMQADQLSTGPDVACEAFQKVQFQSDGGEIRHVSPAIISASDAAYKCIIALSLCFMPRHHLFHTFSSQLTVLITSDST